jgi:hypothetical protein
MTAEELQAKIHECAGRVVTTASANLLLESIRELEAAPDLGSLTDLPRGEAS